MAISVYLKSAFLTVLTLVVGLGIGLVATNPGSLSLSDVSATTASASSVDDPFKLSAEPEQVDSVRSSEYDEYGWDDDDDDEWSERRDRPSRYFDHDRYEREFD